MKHRLIIISLMLLFLTFGLNGLFHFTSLDKYTSEAISNRYGVFLRHFRRHIDAGLRYGKRIERFEGIDRLLSSVRKAIVDLHVGGEPWDPINRDAYLGAVIHLSVVDRNRTIIASTDGKRLGQVAPGAARIEFEDEAMTEAPKSQQAYARDLDRFIVTAPLYEKEGRWAATMLLDVPLSYLIGARDRFAKSLVLTVTVLAVSCAVLLGLLLAITPVTDARRAGEIGKRPVIVILIVFCFGQLLSTGVLCKELTSRLLENTRTENRLLADGIRSDIQHALDLGINLNHLAGIEALLHGVLAEERQASALRLTDEKGTLLVATTREEGFTPEPSLSKSVPDRLNVDSAGGGFRYLSRIDDALIRLAPELFGYRPVPKEGGLLSPIVTVTPSVHYIREQVTVLIMDGLTVSLISLLFFGELLFLSVRIAQGSKNQENLHQPVPIHYSIMRPAAFLFLFGIDISMSFMPLHMEQLAQTFWGLSRDVIMGLPISTEFLFVGFSIFISGVWLDRRGWHEPFITGILLSAIGGLYSWLSPNALHFIFSRAVVGAGYGLALMASQGFVIRFSDRRSKAQGLASLFAGIYAGSICGGAFGGMLAERLGYEMVFLFGALLLFGVALYTLIFMRSAFLKPQTPPAVGGKSPVCSISGKQRFYDFIFNRSVLGLMFFSSLPAAIAAVGFLNYFTPIYLNRQGVSQSDIGRVLMIYGVCLIYFGPLVSRYVDSSMSKKYYIFFGCSLGCGAFLAFQFFQGIAAATVSIFMLGLSNCFILAAQSAYALNMEVTKNLGEGKAIGIFRSTSRVGQMLGPIVFSWVIVATNISQGITYIGLTYLATAMLFLFITKNDRKFALSLDA